MGFLSSSFKSFLFGFLNSTIDIELNNVGGSVKSEALIDATQKAWPEKSSKMIFDSDFILYLKEESKEQPYFALKVDNTDILLEEGEQY